MFNWTLSDKSPWKNVWNTLKGRELKKKKKKISEEDWVARGGLDNIMSKTMVAWKLFHVFMKLNAVFYGWDPCSAMWVWICVCVSKGMGEDEWVFAGEKLER